MNPVSLMDVFCVFVVNKTRVAEPQPVRRSVSESLTFGPRVRNSDTFLGGTTFGTFKVFCGCQGVLVALACNYAAS